MRDPAIVEEDLIDIASIADDLTKFERIVTWCAIHPDEVPFAMKILMNRDSTTQKKERYGNVQVRQGLIGVHAMSTLAQEAVFGSSRCFTTGRRLTSTRRLCVRTPQWR